MFKSRHLYALLVTLVLVIIFVYTVNSRVDPSSYQKQIEAYRKERDRFFKFSDVSPIPEKNSFTGLPYFAPDLKFRVNARLALLENPEKVEMKMNNQKTETYLKYALAHFQLEGKALNLTLFKKEEGEEQLFTAFTDLTSSKETYGGGRYLDIPYNENSRKVTLDFNLSYHPYCLYNENFVCPLPPAENDLKVAVNAGEKLSKEKE